MHNHMEADVQACKCIMAKSRNHCMQRRVNRGARSSPHCLLRIAASKGDRIESKRYFRFETIASHAYAHITRKSTRFQASSSWLISNSLMSKL